jgi:hypothetical protein
VTWRCRGRKKEQQSVCLGELLQKALDPSDHCSDIIYQAACPISQALLSECDKVLEMLNTDRMLISLFIRFVIALIA